MYVFWYFIVLEWRQPVRSSKIYPIATKVGPQYFFHSLDYTVIVVVQNINK